VPGWLASGALACCAQSGTENHITTVAAMIVFFILCSLELPTV
jgi:hypothetical protein